MNYSDFNKIVDILTNLKHMNNLSINKTYEIFWLSIIICNTKIEID